MEGRSEGKFSNAFPQRETRDEGKRERSEKRGQRAMQRRRSRFIAFREQHRQNLISSNESLISRKLGRRDSAEFAPTDGRTSRRRSEAIPRPCRVCKMRLRCKRQVVKRRQSVQETSLLQNVMKISFNGA